MTTIISNYDIGKNDYLISHQLRINLSHFTEIQSEISYDKQFFKQH
ncbi:hypothetical protein [Vibrio europaeus]|nr:hypothetical protein [Vibrio europaeus]